MATPAQVPDPLVYVISSHGSSNFDGKTAVPPKTTVLFYQGFDQSMDNATAIRLQKLLGDNPYAETPTRAAWFGNSQGDAFPPKINFSGDKVNFYSGIVCSNANEVVRPIALGVRDFSLTHALETIRKHADANGGPGVPVKVHCLFCLTSER